MAVEQSAKELMPQAEKYLGLGQPPSCYGQDAANDILKKACDPRGKPVVVEEAEVRVDIPISDDAIPKTFGPQIACWNLARGTDVAGYTTVTNTMNVPGMLPGNTLMLGWRIQVSVEPQNKSIPGQFVNPKTSGGTLNLIGSPDAASENDNLRALGLGAGQTTPLAGQLLFGLPTWLAAYAMLKAYEGVWEITHQEQLIKQPLITCARIDPFAEADAAGQAFSMNQVEVLGYNQRLLQFLGVNGTQFQPVSHLRLGSATEGGTNQGVFSPTRDLDASSTMFGGIGVPQSKLEKPPLLFAKPVFWPAGVSQSFYFSLYNSVYQAEMQRWLSLTGGANGNTGQDLTGIPWSSTITGGSDLVPSTTGAGIMREKTLDPAFTLITEQLRSNRGLGKAGRILIAVGAIGRRIPDSWNDMVAQAIAAGDIACPAGHGPGMGMLVQKYAK